MNADEVAKLLEAVRAGEVSVAEAVDRLRALPFADLGFAKLDTHRELRKGFPEVIYSEGKTPAQVIAIMRRLREDGRLAVASRANPELYRAVAADFPDARYNEEARMIVVGEPPVPDPAFAPVAVVTGGTADLPVAEEAAMTAETMGRRVERIYDVGVAGIHRLLHHQEALFRAGAVVVVAGMEGALASVVGGLVRAPVIAVPTSVGYGASFRGLAPLLAMLNTCAPGVAVVNIDNGFGAGYFAALVVGRAEASP
jgi:NCAIR mutase (PurE)-related protein